MMKWEDEGVLLSSRSHGENNAIIEVLTRQHGLHAGMVKYAYSRKQGHLLEPGLQLNLVWTARLSEHLGVFLIDKVKSRTSALIQNRHKLLGFNSIVSILLLTLPDRESCERIYEATIDLLESMELEKCWISGYVRWELLILAELGFGLDLSVCAVTGQDFDLAYVSPKTGRAVSESVGEEWKEKLISLPPFLTLSKGVIETDPSLLYRGMSLTGYFLEKWLIRSLDKSSLPEARNRFYDSLLS